MLLWWLNYKFNSQWKKKFKLTTFLSRLWLWLLHCGAVGLAITGPFKILGHFSSDHTPLSWPMDLSSDLAPSSQPPDPNLWHGSSIAFLTGRWGLGWLAWVWLQGLQPFRVSTNARMGPWKVLTGQLYLGGDKKSIHPKVHPSHVPLSPV